MMVLRVSGARARGVSPLLAQLEPLACIDATLATVLAATAGKGTACRGLASPISVVISIGVGHAA